MIIYVEDNINNQRLMQKMLSRRGLHLEVYDNAESGFRAIQELKPEMIFVDVHLKGRTNGLDLVRWVRQCGIKTPMIAVTVFSVLVDKQHALQLGCDGYLSKPYTIKELMSVLDHFLVTDVSS